MDNKDPNISYLINSLKAIFQLSSYRFVKFTIIHILILFSIKIYHDYNYYLIIAYDNIILYYFANNYSTQIYHMNTHTPI